MNRSVWKYPLAVTDVQTLRLPKGAEVLTVDAQNGAWNLWALVTPLEADVEERTIAVFGTGHDAPPADVARLSHIATFQQEGGLFVWHAFEVLEP